MRPRASCREQLAAPPHGVHTDTAHQTLTTPLSGIAACATDTQLQLSQSQRKGQTRQEIKSATSEIN